MAIILLFVIFQKQKSCLDVGILSKTTGFRKNSWELNHSRVSSAMGQKLLSRSIIDYATAVRWRSKLYHDRDLYWRNAVNTARDLYNA